MVNPKSFLLALLSVTFAILQAQVTEEENFPTRFHARYQDGSWLSDQLKDKYDIDFEIGRSIALLCAISEYPNMSGNEFLEPAEKDLQKLQEYFTTIEKFDEVIVLHNETFNQSTLIYLFQDYLPRQLQKYPNSRFLFTFSGHGMEDDSNGYLLQQDATSLHDKGNAINMKSLKILVDEVTDKAYHTLCLINSCYSGSFLKRPFGGNFIPYQPGAHAITAGGSDEVVWADPSLGDGSIFFEKFFRGLQGYADTSPKGINGGQSGDGIITVDELSTYLKREVKIFTDQESNPHNGDISKNGSKGTFFFLTSNLEMGPNPLPKYTVPSKTVDRPSFGDEIESQMIDLSIYDFYPEDFIQFFEDLNLFTPRPKMVSQIRLMNKEWQPAFSTDTKDILSYSIEKYTSTHLSKNTGNADLFVEYHFEDDFLRGVKVRIVFGTGIVRWTKANSRANWNLITEKYNGLFGIPSNPNSKVVLYKKDLPNDRKLDVNVSRIKNQLEIEYKITSKHKF